MKTWKLAIPLAIALLLAGQVAAQTDEGVEQRSAEIERRNADVERRLADAEKRMAEAAREMAELTSERLPHLARIERHVEFFGRPRLGVTIGGDDEKEPVEGVTVIAVTPGTAASDAGLRAGDVLISINKESLSASSSEEANEKLLDFMSGVEHGDALDVEYLRNGKVGKVELMPKAGGPNVFIWEGDERDFDIPVMPGAPRAHIAPRVGGLSGLSFMFSGHGLGDMELVELGEGLGRYFGTDSGLLVVSAPKSNRLQLQDGDVIKSIDGREPKSVRHGLQILGSYEAGEKLELQIMRDKKSRTLNIEMPDDRSSMLFENFSPSVRPTAVPVPVPAPAPLVIIERT